MKYLSKSIGIFVLTIFISACQHGLNPDDSQKAGFEKRLVAGNGFLITTYQKINDKTKPYVFYIEGDGSIMKGKHSISDDPTPRTPMLINLAFMDSRPNVVYLARPCQYTPMELNSKCNSDYWLGKRMSDDVVESLNQVINTINGQQKFNLVGFSGGGGVAVLIAARNNMVKDIITIAGNLDHVAFSELHKSRPMLESLNPIDYAEKINYIPQLHLSGGKDTRVPPMIAERFVKRSASSSVKQKIYQENSHNDGWKEIWESAYRNAF